MYRIVTWGLLIVRVMLAALVLFSAGCDAVDSISSAAKRYERLADIAIDELPKLTVKADEIIKKSEVEIEKFKVDMAQHMGEEARLAELYAKESIINQSLNSASDAMKRTMVKACADDLSNAEIGLMFSKELEFRSVAPLPVALSHTKSIVLNILEGSDDVEPLSLDLAGFGLDREVADDDWELALISETKEVFKVNATNHLNRGNGGFSARVNIAGVCRSPAFKEVAEGDYRLTLRNKYSDNGCLVELDAHVNRGAQLPTIAVEIASITLSPQQSASFYKGGMWTFRKYTKPDDFTPFTVRTSDNDDLWGSAVVTLEVTYDIVDGRSLRMTAAAHMLEWEENGSGPRNDYTGGTASVTSLIPIPLPEDCVAEKISGRTSFGRSEHLVGDGRSVSWDGQQGEVIRAVRGQAIWHHRSIPRAEFRVEFYPVFVKYRRAAASKQSAAK
jgi:hypothetical protein